MTKTIEFRGYSDDTFGFEITDGTVSVSADDHDDCANCTMRAYRVASASTGTAVIVTGVYGKCPRGTWSIGISPDDEDVAIPTWAANPQFRTYGHTPILMLIAPDDVVVTLACVDGKPV